jgi:hypothetical protein
MLRLMPGREGARTKGGMSWLILAVSAVLAALPGSLCAQETGQKTFASPQEALTALVDALKAGDRQELLAILGPEGKELISSGDEVQDRADRDRFLAAYDKKADCVPQGNDRVEVILGNDNWPFPIPIVKGQEGWFFDTAAGKEEILNRRIGRNELYTIQVCLAYVEAQREYAGADRQQDGIIQYAQKIVSDPNERNGLYWPVTPGEVPSPFGPLAAQAAAEGYKRSEKPTPFHGYYYRILKGQGAKAPGGAYSYVIHGHMVAGFALVAWPAEYGVSGVMTFVVNRNGIVYQKDLGPKTDEIAKAMTLYNPDQTWSRAQ